MAQPADVHCSCCSHMKKEPNRAWKVIRRWAPQITFAVIRLLQWALEHPDQMGF